MFSEDHGLMMCGGEIFSSLSFSKLMQIFVAVILTGTTMFSLID
jgi:hypothetical protein